MAKFSVTGTGHNSLVSLGAIHVGNCSFKKDTSTTHDQVKLMQSALTSLGYNTQGADGKFGSNTETQVKNFQRNNGLTADGFFGKNSLLKLEEELGHHLDPVLCHEGDTIDKSKSGYHIMQSTDSKRVNSYSDALQKIRSYRGGSLSWSTYEANLKKYASDPSTRYASMDCSGYTQAARNGLGYHGSTTNLCQDVVYFGHIYNLGGYDYLIPGMELYQGCRKSATSDYFWTIHIGVYAGKKKINGKYQHAVWQSSDDYGTLNVEYTKTYDDGPNLTSMNNKWIYWGWSKHVNQN